tara:strand:- start:1761 stop:2405 length:645 start_codon:yes stop_codon:yes gene_type:complete
MTLKPSLLVTFGLLVCVTVFSLTLAVDAKDKKPARKTKEFQATCPVLGEPAEQDAVITLRGKKLYFCCQSCPDIFAATPNVYTTAVHKQWYQTGEIVQVACPLKGHDLDPELSVTVAVGGVKVKVCCPGCANKLAALKGDKKVAAVFAKIDKGFTLQSKCPVSGKPIDTKHVTTFQKKKAWFCCPKCKKAFIANPKKYLAKLPQLKTAKKTKKK